MDIKRLDQFYTEVLSDFDVHRMFLKMDIQGHDLEVFNGAMGILSKIVGFQSEIQVISAYEKVAGYLSALDAHHSAGFSVTGIYPISRGKETMAVIEFDSFMTSSHQIHNQPGETGAAPV